MLLKVTATLKRAPKCDTPEHIAFGMIERRAGQAPCPILITRGMYNDMGQPFSIKVVLEREG